MIVCDKIYDMSLSESCLLGNVRNSSWLFLTNNGPELLIMVSEIIRAYRHETEKQFFYYFIDTGDCCKIWTYRNNKNQDYAKCDAKLQKSE